MNNTRNFCSNLRLLKERSNQSLMKFSEMARVPKSTMQSMLEGKPPCLDTACKVSNSFRIPLSMLTGGELQPETADMLHSALMMLEIYRDLPVEKQERTKAIVNELLEVLRK